MFWGVDLLSTAGPAWKLNWYQVRTDYTQPVQSSKMKRKLYKKTKLGPPAKARVSASARKAGRRINRDGQDGQDEEFQISVLKFQISNPNPSSAFYLSILPITVNSLPPTAHASTLT
jgi:hypothetical protein